MSVQSLLGITVASTTTTNLALPTTTMKLKLSHRQNTKINPQNQLPIHTTETQNQP